MDLKQLRALVAVAETKSVTRAAALLNRVQPAISRQLQLLEQDMQVELFERGRHGMTLTREGEILVDYARRALNELDRARAEILPKDAAIQGIDSQRAGIGAVQNRLSSTISNLSSVSESVSAARSQIQDADFAKETANLTRTQILQQAGISVLAQANALPQQVLGLLQ